jgi:hypothetical protein
MYFFILTLVLFTTFLILLITGIVKQKRKLIYISLIALLLSIAGGLCIGVIIAKKAYTVIKNAKNPLAKRSGMEIYTALFDAPVTTCVSVTSSQDQYIPMVDCCIWLEFTTCPLELERIIARKQLIPLKSQAQIIGDSLVTVIDSMPVYSPRPVWFNPKNLGEGFTTLRKFNRDNPNRDIFIYFSKDSTHAIYCDMAE